MLLERLGRKTSPSSTLSTTNPTRTSLGENPILRGDMPATNSQSYGMAFKLFTSSFKCCETKSEEVHWSVSLSHQPLIHVVKDTWRRVSTLHTYIIKSIIILDFIYRPSYSLKTQSFKHWLCFRNVVFPINNCNHGYCPK
jgi:hypothetical protein